MNYQHFLDVEKSKDIITGVMITLLSFQCFISSNSIKTLINSDTQKMKLLILNGG